MLKKIILVIVAAFLLAEATDVKRCPDDAVTNSFRTIKDVTISNCDKPPCKLKQRTTVSLVQKFVPDRDINKLTTSVTAEVLSLPLPFIGVDGTDACGKIYSGDVQVGCPLKAGTEYVYKNSFPISQYYPKLSIVVHWALTENSKDVTCFEIPSKIAS